MSSCSVRGCCRRIVQRCQRHPAMSYYPVHLRSRSTSVVTDLVGRDAAQVNPDTPSLVLNSRVLGTILAQLEIRELHAERSLLSRYASSYRGGDRRGVPVSLRGQLCSFRILATTFSTLAVVQFPSLEPHPPPPSMFRVFLSDQLIITLHLIESDNRSASNDRAMCNTKHRGWRSRAPPLLASRMLVLREFKGMSMDQSCFFHNGQSHQPWTLLA